MLSKPVAVVLLLAAVLIAAFVGGFAYNRFGTQTEASEDLGALGDTEPSASSAGGADGRAGAPPRKPGGLGPRPGGGSAPPGGSAGSTGSSTGTSGQPNVVPGGGTPTGTGTGGGTLVGGANRAPIIEDVVIPAGQIITIQLMAPLSSETAKVEDPAEAMLAEDIKVDQKIAVPAGAKVLGSVMLAEKGGKVKEPARLGVRFHALVLAKGEEVKLVIDPLISEGVAPSGRSKVAMGGGAAVGVGLGWLLGGTEGAIKGGVTGLGGGTAATMMTKAQPAVVPAGAKARVQLKAPVTVRVERE